MNYLDDSFIVKKKLMIVEALLVMVWIFTVQITHTRMMFTKVWVLSIGNTKYWSSEILN